MACAETVPVKKSGRLERERERERERGIIFTLPNVFSDSKHKKIKKVKAT
jgi:hypothetical protein